MPPAHAFEPAAVRTASGKACTPENTHGVGGNEFVRARLIGQDEGGPLWGTELWAARTAQSYLAVPAGVNASFSFVLEVWTHPAQWRRLTWAELYPHLPYGRKLHVIFVGADMAVFAHAHPDALHEPDAADSHFSVVVPLVAAQQYSLAVEYFFDADAADVCMLEESMHSHGTAQLLGVSPSTVAAAVAHVQAALHAAASLTSVERARCAEAALSAALLPGLEDVLGRLALLLRLHL